MVLQIIASQLYTPATQRSASRWSYR